MMAKLKIALIHPNFKNKVYETLSVPLGLAWISSCLKKSSLLEISCFDFAKDEFLLQQFFPQDFGVLCIQIHSQETQTETIAWIESLKKLNQKMVVIVGGIAVDLDADTILRNDCIDIASLGEGEMTIYELCEAIALEKDICNIQGIAYKENGIIKYTPRRPINFDIDSLPMPDREAFGIDYPQWSIITARGCPFKCKFCSVPKIQNIVRYRTIKNVYEEIMFLYDKYEMKSFFVVDDTFTMVKERVIELCKLLISDYRKVEWTCVTRADKIDKEILTFMKKAGCIQISCGIESANDDIQQLMGKKLNISEALNNLRIAMDIGIRVRCSFIFGLPGETIEHIIKSVKFMKKLRPNEIQIYPYVPYSGTELIDRHETYGLKVNSIQFKDKKNLLDPFVETEGLTRSQIVDVSMRCIEELKQIGYLWIPRDVPATKQKLEYVVMTEFSPVQTLC